MSLVSKITMTDAKVKFGKLSLNNQYQVHFAGFNSSVQNYLRNNVGILNADDFISREMGILCFDASLPATALATAEVKDNFMGVPQGSLIQDYTQTLIFLSMLIKTIHY